MHVSKEKIIGILEVYYKNNVSVEQLCAITGMSRSTISDILNSKEGVLYRYNNNLFGKVWL